MNNKWLGNHILRDWRPPLTGRLPGTRTCSVEDFAALGRKKTLHIEGSRIVLLPALFQKKFLLADGLQGQPLPAQPESQLEQSLMIKQTYFFSTAWGNYAATYKLRQKIPLASPFVKHILVTF